MAATKKKTTLRASGKKDLIDTVIAKINAGAPRKKDGPQVEAGRTTKEIISRVRYVVPVDLEPYDAAIGGNKFPGIPFGRLSEFYGLEGSGKTAIVLRAAVKAQTQNILECHPDGTFTKLDPDTYEVTTLFIDNEQSFADGSKVTVEGQLLDCVLARTDTVSDLFKVIDTTIKAVEDYEDAQPKANFKLQLVIVVVDTIAGTASKEELAQDWGKDDFSRAPKQLRQGFRKLIRKVSRRNVALLCTNQVSDSFAPKKKGPVSFMPNEADFSTSGGRAVKFFARLRSFFYVANDNYKLSKKSRFPDGRVIGFKITKNSQMPPSRGGRLVLLYNGKNGGGYSREYSLLEQFIFQKAAEVGDKGAISFRFKSMGVQTTTFGESNDSSLEDDDAGTKEAKAKGNPKIASKLEWMEFYHAHRADFDALWAVCKKQMFEANDVVDTDDEDEDEIDEIDEDDLSDDDLDE